MVDSRRDGRAPLGLVTSRQIAYWRRVGLLLPGRGELTQARALAALRRAGLSPRRIRDAADRLSLRPAPGAPAGPPPRLAVHGQELYVQRPGGAWEGDRAPGQLVLDHVVPLVPLDEMLTGAPGGGRTGTNGAMGGGMDGGTDGVDRGADGGRPGGALPRRRQPRALPDREEIARYLAREGRGPDMPG